MKILYLAHRIPYPPNKGEKTRCFYQVQYLSAQHSIDLFCFADNEREAQGKQALEKLCRSVHVETLTPNEGYARAAAYAWKRLPLSVLYYQSQKMKTAVEEALKREAYDLIFVYCSSMAQFVPRPTPVFTMIDFVDADSAKWKQYAASSSFPKSWFYAREGSLLAGYETQVAEQFGASIVATQQEAEELGGGGCARVNVVENGVTWPEAHVSTALSAEIQRLQPYALFVGTMNYRPNVDAVSYFSKEIFPLLRSSHPELRFLIVGRDPAAEVQKLAGQPGVIVTGSVPDVHEYVEGAAVAVAPFRIAQGVQNKVLEALVAGLPVVLTSRPARAIGDVARGILQIADAPTDFAAAVRAVLEKPEIRARAAAAAPALRQCLSWDAKLQRLGALVASAAAPPAATCAGVLPEVAVG